MRRLTVATVVAAAVVLGDGAASAGECDPKYATRCVQHCWDQRLDPGNPVAYAAACL